MTATQTHRQIIIVLVHQVIMIIYKYEGRRYIKNKLINLLEIIWGHDTSFVLPPQYGPSKVGSSNNPFVIGEFFFHGNFTLRPHILILRIVLINLWVQFYLVYKIWVHIPKSLLSSDV
jgi:hypothetical protein